MTLLVILCVCLLLLITDPIRCRLSDARERKRAWSAYLYCVNAAAGQLGGEHLWPPPTAAVLAEADRMYRAISERRKRQGRPGLPRHLLGSPVQRLIVQPADIWS